MLFRSDAGLPDRLDFGARGVHGDVDRQREARCTRGIRERQPVISRRRGYERRRIGPLLFDECQDSVERAADLVRKSGLKRFELEEDIATGRSRQPRRIP